MRNAKSRFRKSEMERSGPAAERLRRFELSFEFAPLRVLPAIWGKGGAGAHTRAPARGLITALPASIHFPRFELFQSGTANNNNQRKTNRKQNDK